MPRDKIEPDHATAIENSTTPANANQVPPTKGQGNGVSSRLRRLAAEFAQDLSIVFQPRQWFGFRGRMNRKAFWTFYLFNIMVISIGATASDLVASAAPGAAGYLVPLILLLVTTGSMVALCGAMIRRVRDAGMSIWIPPLALLSLFAAITVWLIEGAVYQMNVAQGTLAPWIATRWPLTEGAGLVALVFAVALFIGLVRRTRPKID